MICAGFHPRKAGIFHRNLMLLSIILLINLIDQKLIVDALIDIDQLQKMFANSDRQSPAANVAVMQNIIAQQQSALSQQQARQNNNKPPKVVSQHSDSISPSNKQVVVPVHLYNLGMPVKKYVKKVPTNQGPNNPVWKQPVNPTSVVNSNENPGSGSNGQRNQKPKPNNSKTGFTGFDRQRSEMERETFFRENSTPEKFGEQPLKRPPKGPTEVEMDPENFEQPFNEDASPQRFWEISKKTPPNKPFGSPSPRNDSPKQDFGGDTADENNWSKENRKPKTMENDEEEDDWEDFKSKYNKFFQTSALEKVGRKNFLRFVGIIKKHNAEYSRGKQSFKIGLNRFCDMSVDKLISLRNRYLKVYDTSAVEPYVAPAARRSAKPDPDLPDDPVTSDAEDKGPGGPVQYGRARKRRGTVDDDEVNYVSKKCVTPVQDQGLCGSCWAFAASAAVEGHICSDYSELIKISDQQLIDCSSTWEYGNSACSGGDPRSAWHYLGDTGINNIHDYPLTQLQKTDLKLLCKYHDEDDLAYRVRQTTSYGNFSFGQFNANDVTSIMEGLKKFGPLTASIAATTTAFHLYKSGVYREQDCPNEESINHVVAIVGYGTDKETELDYWLIKNSWGTTWGENGYARIARGVNQCGIEIDVAYPIVEVSHEAKDMKRMEELKVTPQKQQLKNSKKVL